MLLFSFYTTSNPRSHVAFSFHILLVFCVLEQFSVCIFHEIVIFVEQEPVVYGNSPNGVSFCFLIVRFSVCGGGLSVLIFWQRSASDVGATISMFFHYVVSFFHGWQISITCSK